MNKKLEAFVNRRMLRKPSAETLRQAYIRVMESRMRDRADEARATHIPREIIMG